MLGVIDYQSNEAVLHTDERLLRQPRRRGRAGTSTSPTSRQGRTTVTYHMNRLQSLVADREFLVTLNRTEAIDPARVIRRISYSHPVYTAAAVRRNAGRRSAAPTAPTTAARTGAGASTRTACGARSG